jgi:hypothetical protein
LRLEFPFSASHGGAANLMAVLGHKRTFPNATIDPAAKEIGPPTEAGDRRARAASVKTNQTQQENLFVFVRARPDAVVSRLRVHDLIRIILHGTRDPLDAVKLIRPRRKCIRNRFVGSHF